MFRDGLCGVRGGRCGKHQVWKRCLSYEGHAGSCVLVCGPCRAERQSRGQTLDSFGVVA